MAIKANASSQGAGNIKRFVGVGSFRVLGVNPTKEEMSKFFGSEVTKEPEYLKDMKDSNDNDKPYKQIRITFLVQADKEYEDGTPISSNAALSEPFKTTISFFLDSRYMYNKDKTKVQVEDKYGRTAWVTIEQCKNHQIPVYKNGPARIDADYRPAYRGEEALTAFILNYLNVTPIETYNKTTGSWMTNSNPEDCEGRLTRVQDYFKGDISELKEYCGYMPYNRVKLLVGVKTDNEGKQYASIYTRKTLRNGSKSYTVLSDELKGNPVSDTVFTMDSAGLISDLAEYKEVVKETSFSAEENDPFKAAAALPDDDNNPPFDDDPFKGM